MTKAPRPPRPEDICDCGYQDVECWIRQLRAAGWLPWSTRTGKESPGSMTWKSPDGLFYRGPYLAWRVMKDHYRRSNDAAPTYRRTVLYRCDRCAFESWVTADHSYVKAGRPRLCPQTNCGGTQEPAPLPQAETLARDEWLRRYKQRFIDVAALDERAAEACANAVTFEEASDTYEDDPEGAADMEMSYWDGD